MGRAYVLLADRAGLGLDAPLECPPGVFRSRRVAVLVGVDQALEVVLGKLGVDRQPDRRVGVALGAGQANGEVDALVAAGPRGDLALVLAGREDQLEQGAELQLAEAATRAHVGQHLLEVAHAAREASQLA